MVYRLMFFILLIICFAQYANSIEYRSYSQNLEKIMQISKIDKSQSMKNNSTQSLNDQNQYKFDKSFIIPQTFSTLQHINILQNDTIALDGSNNGIRQVKIFSGPNYQVKKSEINISLKSTVKFSNNKLYINDGSSLSQNSSLAEEPEQYPTTGKFMGGYLVTDSYILFPNKSRNCLSLVKIDKITKKMQNFYPTGEQNCSCTSCGLSIGWLRNLQNGKIGYQTSSFFYILDEQTLKLESTLYSSLGSFDYWYDQKTNESVFLILNNASLYTKYVYNKDSKKYEQKLKIYEQNKLKLIGTNEAYGVQFLQGQNSQYEYNLWHSKLQQQYLYIDFSSSDQSLIDRLFLSMPKSQKYFIMGNKNQRKIQIYELNESNPKYLTNLTQTISMSIDFSAGQLSSDEKLLFISSLSSNKLSIYNMITKQFTNITGKKYIGYCLFNSDENRFIMLYSLNQTVDNVTKTNYWIQIRSLASPQAIIKNIKLVIPESTKIYNVKILTNDNWKQQFLVLYKTIISSYNDTSMQQLCNIKNDQLIQQQLLNLQISFINTYSLQNWIVSIPFRSSAIFAYHRSNITLANTLKLSQPSYYLTYQVFPIISNNKIILQTPSNKQEIVSFDFDTNDYKLFIKNKLYTPYYASLGRQLPQYSMYFPKKQLFFMYTPQGSFGTYIPIKLIFNANFPINNKVMMSNVQGTGRFYIFKNINRDCDLIADYAQQSLRVWKNCAPYEQMRKYLLPKLRAGSNQQIYQTSSQKHVVLKYRTGTSLYKIEIREIDNDFNIVWQIQHDNTTLRNVDLTNDNKLILIYNTKVEIANLMTYDSALNYKLKNISSFDSPKQGNLAISGQNIISTDQNRITSFIVLDKQKKIKFQKDVQHSFQQIAVALNQNGQKVIICYKIQVQSFIIQVWDINTKQHFFQIQLNGSKINQIRFINENQIFVNIDDTGSIVAINTQLKNFQNLLQFPTTSLYTISKDGNLLAFVVNNITVDIYDSNQNKISDIQLQNISASISSLTFSENNTLFIVDSNSNIYIFNSNQCPKTFVDENSYCVCRQYSTLSGQTCQCNLNFYDLLDGSCGCPDPFKLNEKNCQCRSNQTQIGNGCQCNSNFIKNNFECLCSDPFTIIGENCSCRNNQTQVGNACQCNKNFVKNNLQCLCQNPFTLIGENCSCRINQTQVGNSCQCNTNFVKSNLECLCEKPFELSEDKCQCPANSTQKLNQCICAQNYVKKDGLCLCPQTFIVEQGKCFCSNQKYLQENECHACSFWCSECTGSGFSCSSYSIEFYLIVIGGGILLLGGLIVTIVLIRKNMSKEQNGKQKQESEQKQKTNESIESEVLVDESLRKPLKN